MLGVAVVTNGNGLVENFTLQMHCLAVVTVVLKALFQMFVHNLGNVNPRGLQQDAHFPQPVAKSDS